MNITMESPSLSSSSMPEATNRTEVGVHEDVSTEYQTQTLAHRSVNGESETDTDNDHSNAHQESTPLSPSETRPSTLINLTTAGVQRRRRPTEQANRGRLLETQLDEERQRQHQRQSDEQEAEREVVLPATTTTMAQKSLFVLRPVQRYQDLVCIGLSVMAYLLETTMNAALAIFGIGVGVGLVLGDSFRAALPLLPSVQASQQQQTQQSGSMANSTMGDTAATLELLDSRRVPNLLPAQ